MAAITHLGRFAGGVRWFAQWVWVRLLLFTGCLWWAKRQLRQRGTVVVLTFHRVLDQEGVASTDSLSDIVVRKSTFELLVRHVSRKYQAVDLATAHSLAAARGLKVAFTFDDGWQDNFLHAMPVLRGHGIPFTVFLCTGLADKVAPFWPERVRGRLRVCLGEEANQRPPERLIEALVESMKYCGSEARERRIRMLQGTSKIETPISPKPHDATLSWDEVKEMRQAGVRFGSHSHTHQILTVISNDEMRSEIGQSRLALVDAVGGKCDMFAYPNGNQSPEIRSVLVEQGYRFAFTTERRPWLPSTDPLLIPRANVQEQDLIGLTGGFSPAMFEYATSWKIWQAMRRS